MHVGIVRDELSPNRQSITVRRILPKSNPAELTLEVIGLDIPLLERTRAHQPCTNQTRKDQVTKPFKDFD